MAGEIKINDVSIATESGGTVTLGNATLGSTVVLGTNASPIASNLVLAAGNGIDFSAASGSAAGSSSAVLDDYEEGTWTPTVVVGGSSATLSSDSFGIYTLVGDLCHVQGRIAANSGNWGSTGNFVVGGFPFGVRVTNTFLNLPLISHFRSKLGLQITVVTNGGTGGTIYIQPNSTGDNYQAQVTGDVAHTGVLELNFSYRKV